MTSTAETGSVRRYGLFIDESGHAHHNNFVIDPNNPYLTVCGVLFSEPEYRAFRTNFRNLKQNFFNDKNIIFHSRDIRKQQGKFRILSDPKVNSYFISELNQVIANAKFEIMAILIDKRHYMQIRPFSAFEIYTIALEFLMERTLYRLQPKNAKNIQILNSVKIIAESRGAKEDVRLLSAYNKFLDTGNDFNSAERFKKLFSGFSFKKRLIALMGWNWLIYAPIQ